MNERRGSLRLAGIVGGICITVVGDAALVRRVVSAARLDDPSIDPRAALVLAQACLAQLRDGTVTTAPDLARAVLRQLPNAEVSWVNHVARNAVRLSRDRPDAPPAAG